MPRQARSSFKTHFFHVMVQGINKDFIFLKEYYIETYLNLIHKYIKEFPVTILSYCIMNNHAHILVFVENVHDLGKFMHKVNLVYSQFYNKENNRCGVVFRNKYKAEPIYDQKYIINCINYIHMNPVKANMVYSCKDYPYSSYNDYVNNTGICNNKTLYEICGLNYNYYKSLPQNECSIFIDIDSPDFSDISALMDHRIIIFLKKK
ncbi:MAG: transposase [Clostridia bacterium]|nr:transposase [Clostridia bacterium]